MSKTKLCMFTVLPLFLAFLLIPITSAHAQLTSPSPPPTSGPPPVTPVNLKNLVNESLKKTGIESGLASKDDKKQSTLEVFLGRILGAVLALLGIVFLGLTIYGGIAWMLARGNSSEVEKARDTITGAVIGLIIVIIAYAITQFVLRLFTTP